MPEFPPIIPDGLSRAKGAMFASDGNQYGAVTIGADGTVLVASAAAANGVAWAAGGSVTAPGSDTQVIFNDGGVFGASSSLTFDKTNKRLLVNGGPNATIGALIPAGGQYGLDLRQASNFSAAFIRCEYSSGSLALRFDEYGNLITGNNVYCGGYWGPNSYQAIDMGTSTAIIFKVGTQFAPEERMRLTYSGSNGRLGINTTAPDRACEINSTDGNALRLTYNDSNGSATNYVDATVDSAGNGTLTPSGGTLNVAGYLTASSQPVNRSLSVNTADSSAIASTASETNFGRSYSLGAGALNVAGRALCIRAAGKQSCTGTPTLTIRLKWGSTTLISMGAIRASTSTARWSLEAVVVCRTTGSSGTVNTTAGVQVMGATNGSQPATSATVDLTASATIQVSAQWSVSDALNTTTLELLEVEALNC